MSSISKSNMSILALMGIGDVERSLGAIGDCSDFGSRLLISKAVCMFFFSSLALCEVDPVEESELNADEEPLPRNLDDNLEESLEPLVLLVSFDFLEFVEALRAAMMGSGSVSPTHFIRTVTLPPGGVNFKLLLTRLMTTCRIRC